MKLTAYALFLSAALLPSASGEEALPAEATTPILASENGDTALIVLCRTAVSADESARQTLLPQITQLLTDGEDALKENIHGCNALFYLYGMPEYAKELKGRDLLPKELALRIPHEEQQLLRYMKLRTAQAAMAPAQGSRDYLIRRYCAPAYKRAQARLVSYLRAGSLYRVPEDGMKTCLAFMLLAEPLQARTYVNELLLWQHGEHFLEEIPAALLSALQELRWQVPPGKLRLALQQLDSMLPREEGDMIDCFAAAPMARLLEMLVQQEGERALPDLQRYAASFDPELAQAALRLQLKLKGITPPDEEEGEEQTGERAAMRDTLLVDAALHNGTLEGLTVPRLTAAAAYLDKLGLPLHAELVHSLTEDGEIIVTEVSLPKVRNRYEELREKRPRVLLLRRLLEQEDTSRPTENPQS